MNDVAEDIRHQYEIVQLHKIHRIRLWQLRMRNVFDSRVASNAEIERINRRIEALLYDGETQAEIGPQPLGVDTRG